MLWAVRRWYLGPHDGIHAENVALLDPATGLFLGDEDPARAWSITDTGFSGQLVVVGATASQAMAHIAAIDTMLYRAQRARGATGTGGPIVLSAELWDGSWRYIDVLGGTLATERLFLSGTGGVVTLDLITRPFGRGDAVELAPTATLTNGAATWLVEDIPGDVPALARLTLTDEGSAVINGVHVYSRSHPALEAGDYDPVIELTPTLPGVATTDGSSYSGADFARLAANATWRTIAEATRPAGAFNEGVYDLWLRVRDSSDVPSAPQNLSATVTPGVAGDTVGSLEDAVASSTLLITLTDDIGPDDYLALFVRVSNAVTITSVSSVGGAAWTLMSDGVDDAFVADSGARLWLYGLKPTTDIGAGTVVTVTLSGGATNRVAAIRRYRGLATSPVEQVAPDSISSVSGSITTVHPYQLLLAAATWSTESTASFTNLFSVVHSTSRSGLGERLVTSAGTYSTTSGGAGTSRATTLVSLKAATSTAGNIGTGTWRILVVGVTATGSRSVASNIANVEVTTTADVISLSWDAPASGTVTSYRIYRDRGTGWAYIDTGSAATSYELSSETTFAPAEPDVDGDPTGLFRVQIGLVNGVTLFDGPTVAAPLSGGIWCDVLAATVALPPIPALDGDDPPDWLVRVQGMHVSQNPALDVDLAWLVPHDEPQLIARSTGYTLAAKHTWVLDQRRDGRVSGRLYEPGTTNDAGQLDTIGQLLIGPGNAQVALRLTGAGGASDVDTLQCTATLRLVPRYRLLRGAS